MEKECTHVLGSALFFSFSGMKDKSLLCHEVLGERIKPEEANGKLVGSSSSGPLFCEVRNILKLPSKCKGVVCAVMLPDTPGIWRFGIINQIDLLLQVMQLFLWVGTIRLTNTGVIDLDHLEFYPTYYFQSTDMLVGRDKIKSLFCPTHFKAVTLDMNLLCHFKFLNQVRGNYPVSTHASSQHSMPSVNISDGKFEQQFSGPDVFTIPSNGVTSYLFPVVHVSEKPLLLTDSSFDGLTLLEQIVGLKRNRPRRAITFSRSNIPIPPFLKSPTIPTTENMDMQLFVVRDSPVNSLNPHSEFSFISFIQEAPSTGPTMQTFALFPQDKYISTLKAINNSTIEKFNQYLSTNASHTVKLPVISIEGHGTMIKLLTQEEYDSKLLHGTIIELHKPSSTSVAIARAGIVKGLPHLTKGLMMSMMVKLKDGHPGRLTAYFTYLMDLCVRKGFGDRKISSCRGINFYWGLRLSRMSSPSPVEGPGSQDSSCYYRATFRCFHFFFILITIWNVLRRTTRNIANRLDYHMHQFLQAHDDSARTSSKLLLITMGTMFELAFSNCPHVDIHDSYSKQEQRQLSDNIKYWDSLCESSDQPHDEHYTLFPAYVQSFSDKFGFTSPSTCCYQHVKTHDDIQFIQYFVMQGLGCCIPITDYLCHHFYAKCFVHNTSVCLAIENNLVYVLNTNNRFGTVIGWGAAATTTIGERISDDSS